MNSALFEWFDRYRQTRLQLVGLVEILPGKPTEYHWLDEQQDTVSTSAESWLAIFKRRGGGDLPLNKERRP